MSGIMNVKQTAGKSVLLSRLIYTLCSAVCYLVLCFGHEDTSHLFFNLFDTVVPTAVFALQISTTLIFLGILQKLGLVAPTITSWHSLSPFILPGAAFVCQYQTWLWSVTPYRQACHPLVQCIAPLVAFVLPLILSTSSHTSAVCIASVVLVSAGEFTARQHFWQGIISPQALVDGVSLIGRVLYLSLLEPMFGMCKQADQETVHMTVPSLLFLSSLGSLPFVLAILLFHGEEFYMFVSKGSWDSLVFLGLLMAIIILNMLLQLSLLACLHALSPFGVALLDLGYTGLLRPAWLLPLTGYGHRYRAAGFVLCIAGALLFVSAIVKEGYQTLRHRTRSEQRVDRLP
uniref:uncharacterized protein isoform X1 n=1 Tax=Myxine glutinosa TaxID=7769 RepID=UPI00358E5804